MAKSISLLLAALLTGCATGGSPPEPVDTHTYSGEAIYQGRNSAGVVVMIYDSPCQFRDIVSNMHYRATWSEKGQTSEGCVMAHPIAGGRAQVFVFWFDDKTVFAEIVQAFTPVKSM